MIKKGFLKTQGHKVFTKYYRLIPSKKATDVAFIIQGRNESTEMYEHIVHQLQHYLKIDIVLFDLPGQGHSSGEKFHINSFEEDYLNVFSDVFNNFKGKRNHLIGHSTGALIAMLFSLQNEVHEIVLTAPFVKLKDYPFFLPDIKKLSGMIVSIPFMKRWPSRKNESVPFERNNLTDNRILYERFYKGGPPTWNWLYEVSKAQEKLVKNKNQLRAPMLAILAGEDAIVDNSAFKSLVEDLNPRPIIVEFEREKHALFLSTMANQERVINRIVDFIGQQCPEALC